MAKKHFKSGGNIPVISTASLPDIVFVLLFFFMVTTVMREVEPLVRFTLPQTTEATRLEDSSLVDHIYIGPPTRTELGIEPRMQLNDQFARLDDIRPWVEENISRRPEPLAPHIIQALKVDQQTAMQLVTEVKQELRKSSALKISYTTNEQ